MKTTNSNRVGDPLTGYSHFRYAESLSGFGLPRLLPRSHGWLLQRQIPASDSQDAMGCYPIFCCPDWSRMQADLEDLGNEVVSVAIVTDPFGAYDQAQLRECFPDIVFPFKLHFVADLNRTPESFVSAHHQRNARKGLQNITVEMCANPAQVLDDWGSLYAKLTARHKIGGLSAFSREAFAKQLAVPGVTVLRALSGGETVGMTLWYAGDTLAYYHLGAYSDAGYELRASFALFWRAIEHFKGAGLSWLSLGAGAGLSSSADGLSRFKSGWSTETRTAYFCGRIFDRDKYEELVRLKRMPLTNYFPAYRAGEFT